jgi:iron(III) transport system substrate-binding protein
MGTPDIVHFIPTQGGSVSLLGSRIRLNGALCGATCVALLSAGCGGAGTDSKSAESKQLSVTADAACAAADKEGTLNYWSASDPEQFAAEVVPFQKAHPKIKVNFTSLRPEQVAQQVVTEVQGGHALSVDATTTDLPSATPLLAQKLIRNVDYTKLGIAKNLIMETGGVETFRVFRDPLGIGYNTRTLQKADLPPTWDALVDAKWKKKIIVDPRGIYLAGISGGWGEAKTLDWFNRFRQTADPLVIQGATASLQKVTSQEALMTTSATASAIREQQAGGAPLDIQYLDVVTSEDKYGMVLQKAQHPNAAACFMSWWGGPEGQAQQLKVEFKTNTETPEGLPATSKLSYSTTPEGEAVKTKVAGEISRILGQ